MRAQQALRAAPIELLTRNSEPAGDVAFRGVDVPQHGVDELLAAARAARADEPCLELPLPYPAVFDDCLHRGTQSSGTEKIPKIICLAILPGRSGRSGDFEHGGDLARHVVRQRSGAQREARVPSGVAEDVDENLRRGVDHLRMIGELRDRVDESLDHDHPGDAIQGAEVRADLGENVEGAETRSLPRILERDFLADLADVPVLAVPRRYLTGDEECRSRLHAWDVLGHRWGCIRQLD